MALTGEAVAERLAGVRGRIEAAGGDPRAVTVVAVTKDLEAEAVAAALAAGLREVGENRAEQLSEKAAAFPAGTVRWHYLGRVQRNKVARLAAVVSLWQGVDRKVIDDTVNNAADGARHVSDEVRQMQSGNVRSYAGWIASGAAVVIAYMIWWGMR